MQDRRLDEARGTANQGSQLRHRGGLGTPSVMGLLTSAEIVIAFEALNFRLAARGESAELAVVGGAVMCLAFDARAATKDVDAWFAPSATVRAAALEVADELSLPADWLNDAAKAFVPPNGAFELWREWSHLRVALADARTRFAMKAAAARTLEDASDLQFLLGRLGIRTAEEALRVVLDFFPAERLPVRTQLLIEELFE
jgi:hypothetical protein